MSASEIPQNASFVFNKRRSSVYAHLTHWNKMATYDLGPVTVISCETARFFLYIWIISWDATYRSDQIKKLVIFPLLYANRG